MQGGTRVPVLIVEDDPNIRVVICEALTAEGLDVVEACDGEEALELARDRRPSAVVLDMGLPVMDGGAVADKLRDLYGEHIPVIVVTAAWRVEEAAKRVRASAFVVKPFEIADLVRVVTSAIAPPPPAMSSADEPAPRAATTTSLEEPAPRSATT
jgi:CheY-like chemotaxis protein